MKRRPVATRPPQPARGTYLCKVPPMRQRTENSKEILLLVQLDHLQWKKQKQLAQAPCIAVAKLPCQSHLLHGLQRSRFVDRIAVVVQGTVVDCCYRRREWHSRFSRHVLVERRTTENEGTKNLSTGTFSSAVNTRTTITGLLPSCSARASCFSMTACIWSRSL